MATTGIPVDNTTGKTGYPQDSQAKTSSATEEKQGDYKETRTGSLAQDSDLFKSILQLLDNPLTLLIAVLTFFYWQHHKATAVKTAVTHHDRADIEKKLRKAKKKNRRLKKQLLHHQQPNRWRGGSYHEQIA